MKEKDYVLQKGIEPIELKRGVQIGDNTTFLTVLIKKNHKKGVFSLETKISNSQVTGKSVEDKATVKTLSDMLLQAAKIGHEWRVEWDKQNKGEDPNQIAMGFGDDDDPE